MIGLFFVSVLAGIIIGAPFGPAGALVADAGLVHDRSRLKGTIFAAVTGDGLLAFLLSFASNPAKIILRNNERPLFILTGIAIILLGVFLLQAASKLNVSIGKTASSVSVFLITLFHPGSVAAFLVIIGFLSVKFLAFSHYKLIFVGGVVIGSILVFSPIGILFWKLREKAENHVRHIRYAISILLILIGAYLIVTIF